MFFEKAAALLAPRVILLIVDQVIPEAVTKDAKSGFLSLNTTPIFWSIVNAIKELYGKTLLYEYQLAQQDRSIASKADKEAIHLNIQQLEAENKAKDQKIKELEHRDIEMRLRIDKIEKLLQEK